MTKITFYAGMKVIGGTIIDVVYNDSRVIFDCGFTVNFDKSLEKASKSKILNNIFQEDSFPVLDGVFAKKDIEKHNIVPYEERDKKNTAFLVSHMHLDHMGALGLIHENLPVYVTEDSLKLYNGLCKIGDEVVGSKPNLKAVATDKAFKVGDIEVTLIEVDHDVIGACGFKISTPDGEIAYSGDLRLHGLDSNKTLDFANKVRGIDVLIIEGVTISFLQENIDDIISTKDTKEEFNTEIQVIDNIKERAFNNDGVTVVNLYNRNIDRINNLIDMVNQNDKILVLEDNTAKLMKEVTGRDDYKVLQLDKEEIINGIDINEINKNPNKYILQLSYENTSLIKDIKGNTIYLHANGVPLGDYDEKYQILLDILEGYGVDFEVVGSGGHASPENLKHIAEIVQPKNLVPIHSFAPERFRIDESKQILPELGSTYILKDGEMILED